MELNYWAATDIGRKRADNEDNFLVDKNLHLFVVGVLGWLIVGVLWNDRAIMLIHFVALGAMLAGMART